MTRRRLLALLALSATALAAILAAGGAWLWRRGRAPGLVFAEPDLAVLLAVADVIVPRDGAHPAASETPLLDVLARRARDVPDLAQLLEAGLPGFARAVRSRVPAARGTGDARAPSPAGLDAALLARLCESYHRELRERPRPSREAVYFELLRSEVLFAYYATPAGWASVGFDGPVQWSAARMRGSSPS